MKKCFGFILVVLAVAFSAHAAAPSAISSAANYEWGMERVISSSASFDTIAGDDSATLVSKWVPSVSGYDFALVRDAITGGGADSTALQVVLDAYDVSNNFLYRTVIDSFTAASSATPGEAIALPLGSTIFGTKFTIKLKAYTGNGGVVILNRFYIYKRRAITVNKNW